jgi:hypothetical protein
MKNAKSGRNQTSYVCGKSHVTPRDCAAGHTSHRVIAQQVTRKAAKRRAGLRTQRDADTR